MYVHIKKNNNKKIVLLYIATLKKTNSFYRVITGFEI